MTKTRTPARQYGHYDKLSTRHQRFVDEYLIDLNAPRAGKLAGVGLSGSYAVLNRPDVQAAIKERRELIEGERTLQGARFVLDRLWDVATADPRDLVEIRRVPCRFCHGVNGQYQFTQTEMDRLLKAHEYGRYGHPLEAIWPRGAAEYAAWVAGKANLPFDPQGGSGYTANRDPNPECSECHGNGNAVYYTHDTRKLTGTARHLYRGVKWGKGGTEILMTDQDKARDMLAKHYGVAVDRRELIVRTIDPEKLSDEELAAATAELEAQLIEGDYQVIEPPQPAKPVLRRPSK